MHLLRALLVGLLFLTPLYAGSNKKKESHVSFHIETTQGDNPKLIFPAQVAGQQRVFRRHPVVLTSDISAFNPFPSTAGEGYGVVFQLKPGGRNRLEGETAQNISRWMVARINGRLVDAVVIDQPISDGQIVIWKGVSLAEIGMLDADFPRIGADKPRGKQ